MNKKKQKLALVTGAGRGIGEATAHTLLERGYLVACAYRTSHEGVLALEKKYPAAFGVHMDIRDRESVKDAISTIRNHFKQSTDILVNNAGISDEREFTTMTDADWDAMFQINLRGAFIVSQETLPDMVKKRWGRIVNVVSIGGQWGGVRQVHYAAAKAGLINFTKSIARLYSQYSITSNAVSPGLVATKMIQKEMRSKAGQNKLAQIPIGRIAQPGEIAAAVAFLVSDDASYITGHTLDVNGGLLFN